MLVVRATLLYVNGSFAIVAAAFLAYSLFARHQLAVTAHDYLLGRTVTYALPLVDDEEERFIRGLFQQMNKSGVDAVRAEFAAFRRDPRQAIERTLRQPEPTNLKWIATDPVPVARQQITDYYDESFARLLLYVRLFAVSNLALACVLWRSVYRSRDGVHPALLWGTYLLAVSVTFCAYHAMMPTLFFTILTYAAPLCVVAWAATMVIGYVQRHFQNRPLIQDEETPEPIAAMTYDDVPREA